jgi:adenylyltransferase/sulfurtransferase
MKDEQLLRYSRQIMLPDFDIEGQQRVLDARVLIVGLGGLGSPVAMYLASSGVGKLILADFDSVDLSNLQRQIAHGSADIGRLKVASARDAIAALNADVEVSCVSQRLDDEALDRLLASVDLVVDACDNFSTRFAINRACVRHRKPLVSGSAIRSEGQVIVFDSRQEHSPCYRCLYSDAVSEENLTCSESGVIGPLVGVIGSLQALAALKLLSAFGDTAVGQLLVFDGKYQEFRQLKVPKDPGCPVCGSH